MTYLAVRHFPVVCAQWGAQNWITPFKKDPLQHHHDIWMAAIHSSIKLVRARVSSALGIVSTSADSSLIVFFSELGSCPAFHSR